MYVLCATCFVAEHSHVLCHIGITHRFDPGLSILCGLKSCPAIYTNFESFDLMCTRNIETSCTLQQMTQHLAHTLKLLLMCLL